MKQQMIRSPSREFNKLNYPDVNFDQRLRDCDYTRVSLHPEVILHIIGYHKGYDRDTRNYLKSEFSPEDMREFIQLVPINLYSSTIRSLEKVLQPRRKSILGIPYGGVPRKLIPELKTRLRKLLNGSNVRILWNHESLESQLKYLQRHESYETIQNTIKAWKNREFNFADMQNILFSVMERAIPLTFRDSILIFLYKENIPYYETRVPLKLPTKKPLIKIKQQD